MPNPPVLPVDDYRRRLKETVTGPEFQPLEDGTTYCNLFAKRVASWFGCEVFHGDILASEMLKRMQGSEHFSRYNVEAGYAVCDQDAGLGRLVIAAQPPPPGSIHGHVAIVAPEATMVYSPKWGKHVPLVASAGQRNFYGGGLNYAFGRVEPEVYLYLG